MILILSLSGIELSTEHIIDWLNYYNAKVKRINGDDLKEKEFSFNIDNIEETTDFLEIDNVKVVWYRRWTDKVIFTNKSIDNTSILSIDNHRKSEFNELSKYFYYLLRNKKWISKPSSNITKSEMLSKAKNVGLEIPNTLITTKKKDLLDFISKNNNIIIKSISEVFFITYKGKYYSNYTTQVDYNDILKFPDKFYPTLFQKKIEKFFEIRVFYWFGSFHSMAIFSQNDSKTLSDFRNYNYEKPNRNIPYKLPIEIILRLKKLMDSLCLETGSIDLIKTKEGKYIFLEINPIGQFGMTSLPCNYFLERKIAKSLITLNNYYEKND